MVKSYLGKVTGNPAFSFLSVSMIKSKSNASTKRQAGTASKNESSQHVRQMARAIPCNHKMRQCSIAHTRVIKVVEVLFSTQVILLTQRLVKVVLRNQSHASIS